jgi:hypothetical protein
MAVFRIEKTQNYTVMSNHHLRNAGLSLKAKGLLSQMLSLPEDWDYTLAGLSHINRESVEAIRTAVLELETAGYVVRRQTRGESGRMGTIEYTIYEQPMEPGAPPLLEITATSPSCDFPITVKPTSDKPLSDFPTSENATQLNKEVINKEKPNTESSSTESYLIPSPEGEIRKDVTGEEAAEIYRKVIKENIGYDDLVKRRRFDRERIGEIVDLMLETICTSNKTLVIAGDKRPAGRVRSKLMKLDGSHIEYVLDCMKKCRGEIRNIKKYMLAALFNAPSTIDSYYAALVAHDMASGRI